MSDQSCLSGEVMLLVMSTFGLLPANTLEVSIVEIITKNMERVDNRFHKTFIYRREENWVPWA
jgi:hypothetical protein